MFRRYPYWGWLALSILLWCINGYYFHMHRQDMLPDRMTQAVNTDLHRREQAFAQFVQQQDLVQRMFTDSLSLQECGRINSQSFFVYAYDSNYLRYWNTNTILAAPGDTITSAPALLQNEKGTYLQRTINLDNGRKLVALFPILITYPIENDYLRSHFAASTRIPVRTRIIAAGSSTKNGHSVTSLDGHTILYLLFDAEDVQKWVPDVPFIILLVAALLATISWLHLMIIYLTRNRSSLVGLIFTLSVIVALRVLLYTYGIPFNLDQLLFFSPRLYASSTYLSSFGDLFINTLCVLWLVVFITRHTPYKTYLRKLTSPPLRLLVAIVLIALMIAYVFLFVALIRSLVLDSSISFDVSHFYSINLYSILGLLVICTITGISCLIIYLFNLQFQLIISNKWLKYALIAAAGVLSLFISHTYTDTFYWILLGWLLVFVQLLDVRKLHIVSDLFARRMIFWAVFICMFCTGLLQYFNDIKERGARKAYVEQNLSPHRDNLMEYAFDRTVSNLEKDRTLKSFFYHPTVAARRAINQRFDTSYLKDVASKYDVSVYLFDEEGTGLYNKDSADYYSLVYEKNESVSTNSPYLFYKETILDKHFYISFIPVYSDTINNKIGYVVIDMGLKKQAAETVYPELLMPVGSKPDPKDNDYAYAVYINDKLISQKGAHPFTTYLRDDTLKEQDLVFRNENGVSELIYKISDKRTIVVANTQDTWIQAITIFSYLFCMQVVLALVILLYQLYLSYFTGTFAQRRSTRLTLRKQVHYSMLGIVLISFIIIGAATIWLLTTRYSNSTSDKLQSAMQVAKQSVQNYLKGGNAFDTDHAFDSITQSNAFRVFMGDLANNQKIDINIFDNNGNLFATSQEEIYQKGLLSRIMRQDAYFQLNDMGRSIVIQNEQVAGLSYLSAYEPLRDERGITLGYINVPFFTSEKELNLQISNIVVTLINVYAFIFLLSSVITVLITTWITRSFNIIISQFSKLNLQRNERINWPHDDEIGMLVREYNKMVNKVEENAALLAQSERETAWREMARQVAHEIKNPLTPMKLNIQYLQQAIKNDNPNIKELTSKVSASIIEQIDNLTYIASEFSNFAKMPEARAEELDLRELLGTVTELYLTEKQVNVSLTAGSEALHIFSDRSQLLRVFTNLLENAKQAIPASRMGEIDMIATTDNGTVTIAITDNGTGISEEVAQRIFQPYFTTKSSGTGLGLAMTKKIIEFWKGEIWFESVAGEGTTFYIRLPLL